MKVEINIPESLADLKLYQYQRFAKIEEPEGVDTLICFLGLTKKQIDNIKASEVDRLIVHLNSLFEEKQGNPKTFTLNGVEFGFIPDLDNISYGENNDITTYLNDVKNIHKAMAVLYRPITQKQKGKYLIEKYEGTNKYSELMKQMPLSAVFEANVFFYNLTNELLNYIPNYLEEQTKLLIKNNKLSEKNGEDIQKLTHLLKGTLEDLTKLQSYRYISA